MTKTLNPVDQFRRAQRKKEVQKNKVKRITARDAKVAETKSIVSVKAEIDALEKKKTFHEGKLDITDTQKLERLNKELRIVKEAEEKRRLEVKIQSVEEVANLNDEKFGLYAKCSIYYDPVMNPYGAPPPGQPMLYWTEGGSTTMDVNLAVLPKFLQTQSQHDTDRLNPTRPTASLEKTRMVDQSYNAQKPPPVSLEDNAGHITDHPLPSKMDTSTQSKRKMKRSYIWASEKELQSGLGDSVEEIDPSATSHDAGYSSGFMRKRKPLHDDTSDPLCPSAEGYSDYRNVEQISRSIPQISGSKLLSSSKSLDKGPPIQWLYRDSFNNIQGPFPSDQIIAWQEAGFFPPDTLVCKMDGKDFVMIQYVNLETGATEIPSNDSYADQLDTTVQNTDEAAVSKEEEGLVTEYPYQQSAVGPYQISVDLENYFSADMDLYSYPNTDSAYEDGYHGDEASNARDKEEYEMTPDEAKIIEHKKSCSWKDDAVVGFVPSHLQKRK